jgi:hypothetical protein
MSSSSQPVVDFCQLDTAVCYNNGTCVSAETSFTCVCTSGYEGAFCENDVDDCASSPCDPTGAASCFDLGDGLGSFDCKCNEGYAGLLCSETDHLTLLVDVSDVEDVEAFTEELREEVQLWYPENRLEVALENTDAAADEAVFIFTFSDPVEQPTATELAAAMESAGYSATVVYAEEAELVYYQAGSSISSVPLLGMTLVAMTAQLF